MTPDQKRTVTEAAAQANLKVEWANNHIRGVEQLVNSLTAEHANVVRPYQNPNTGKYQVYIGPQNGIPVALPLHMGDATHNLNSVMDYLWSGVARAVTPDLASKVTFPRDETRENLVDRLTNPKGQNATIKVTFPQVERFILDDVKPYKGGNGFIWELNKLDNASKHRLILPTIQVIGFARDLVIQAEDGSRFVNRAGADMKTQGYSLNVGFDAPFEVNDDAEPAINIVFDEGTPFASQPVLETLVNLTKATSKVIDAFKAAFL